MSKVTDNVNHFHKVAQSCLADHHRATNSLILLCVSKNHTTAAIQQAYLAGERHFGENRVQEAVEKMTSLANLSDIVWHYIGTIQRNKTHIIANRFAWVHSVTRLSEAKRFAAQRASQLPPLNVCIEINIDNEPQKSGITAEEALPLALAINTLPAIRLRGLMAIPHPQTQHGFAKMHVLFQQMCHAGIALDTLSMGMSADWQQAIAHGATIVRLGTAIFGQRNL